MGVLCAYIHERRISFRTPLSLFAVLGEMTWALIRRGTACRARRHRKLRGHGVPCPYAPTKFLSKQRPSKSNVNGVSRQAAKNAKNDQELLRRSDGIVIPESHMPLIVHQMESPSCSLKGNDPQMPKGRSRKRDRPFSHPVFISVC